MVKSKENYPKKQGFFHHGEPLKSLGKKGKTLKKARKFLATKTARKSKKARKGRSGNRRNRFPGTETGTGTVLSFKIVLKHRRKKKTHLFVEEPPEPKTGTDRTFPPPNRNRTEPNRGHSDYRKSRAIMDNFLPCLPVCVAKTCADCTRRRAVGSRS